MFLSECLLLLCDFKTSSFCYCISLLFTFTVLISKFPSVLMMLSSNTNYILIGGGFNVNLLASEDVANEYLNLLTDFYLTQHIRDSTRTCDTSATLFDHVISTSSFNISNVKQAVGVSDHRMQWLILIFLPPDLLIINVGFNLLKNVCDLFLPLHVVHSRRSRRPTPQPSNVFISS